MTALRFTLQDVERAQVEWGCNCGPAALAAVLGMTLDEVRPHLGDFEAKRYTNPTLMLDIVKRLRPMRFRWWTVRAGEGVFPSFFPTFGLARIQWTGPWTEPGSNPRWAYRQTHWIGTNARKPDNIGIFDVNAMNSGGWIGFRDWRETLVPWLLNECVPRADGGLFITHCVEIQP